MFQVGVVRDDKWDLTAELPGAVADEEVVQAMVLKRFGGSGEGIVGVAGGGLGGQWGIKLCRIPKLVYERDLERHECCVSAESDATATDYFRSPMTSS